MAGIDKVTTIDIGTVNGARELVFTQGKDDRRYILQAPGAETDYLEVLHRFSAFQVKRTTHFYIDDTDGEWFACYNVDCFDPPMAVIRARSFESAYEVFCDEFADWLRVDEADADDYPEEERNYNGNGVHINTDNVQIYPMRLIAVTIGGDHEENCAHCGRTIPAGKA